MQEPQQLHDQDDQRIHKSSKPSSLEVNPEPIKLEVKGAFSPHPGECFRCSGKSFSFLSPKQQAPARSPIDSPFSERVRTWPLSILNGSNAHPKPSESELPRSSAQPPENSTIFDTLSELHPLPHLSSPSTRSSPQSDLREITGPFLLRHSQKWVMYVLDNHCR